MFPWFQYLIFMFSTVSTPGPNNIMCMTSGSSVGIKKSLPLMLGIWLGISIVTITLTLFCNVLERWIVEYKLYVMIIGAVYILYLAYKTATSPAMQDNNQYISRSFGRGVILQFVNPKLFMFVILSAETYILPYYSGQFLPLVLFALLQSFIGFVFVVLYAVGGTVFRALFGKYRRATNIIMALALVYCAIALFI